MKKLFLFLAMASTTMFVSCGSDDSDSAPAATAITLTSSAATANVGQAVTLSVKNNLTPAVDVTSTSTFTVTPATGATITGASFTATAPGAYKIVAKNGTLTSAEVTVTVSVPVNTVSVNGASGVADKSMLYYLGSTETGSNVFVANPYSQVGEGEGATYPNDVYVYFTSTQEAGSTSITLPALGNYAFGLVSANNVTFDANVIFNSQEVLATEITTDASMNLTRFTVSEAEESYAFTYAIKLANNSYAYGSYDGAFVFSNESGRAARSSELQVVKVTPAELQANLNAVIAKNKK